MSSVRIRVMSDLHLDHHRDGGKSLVDDIRSKARSDEVLVLAGDVFDGFKAKQACIDRLARLAEPQLHTVYVMGNHEFAGHTPAEALQCAWDVVSAVPRVSLLENSSVTINGLTIHGATAWYPKPIGDAWLYKRNMIDFNMIRSFEPWVYNQHQRTVDYMRDNVKKGDVVVNHHLPFEWCIRPFWRKSILNAYFWSQMDDTYKPLQPALMVCGHTHDPFDETVGSHRVVCNPAGYPSERNTINRRFQHGLIADIEAKET